MNPSIRVRNFEPDKDALALRQFDTSVLTNFVYEMQIDDRSLCLRPIALASPQRKHFEVDLKETPWTHGFVAVDEDKVLGFIATNYEVWNRRLTIWHFYVDLPHRHRGIGRLLMEHAIESGRRLGALNAWVETSNLSVPGVEAYRRLGFTLCGGDLTLYQRTPSRNELRRLGFRRFR